MKVSPIIIFVILFFLYVNCIESKGVVMHMDPNDGNDSDAKIQHNISETDANQKVEEIANLQKEHTIPPAADEVLDEDSDEIYREFGDVFKNYETDAVEQAKYRKEAEVMFGTYDAPEEFMFNF